MPHPHLSNCFVNKVSLFFSSIIWSLEILPPWHVYISMSWGQMQERWYGLWAICTCILLVPSDPVLWSQLYCFILMINCGWPGTGLSLRVSNRSQIVKNSSWYIYMSHNQAFLLYQDPLEIQDLLFEWYILCWQSHGHAGDSLGSTLRVNTCKRVNKEKLGRVSN